MWKWLKRTKVSPPTKELEFQGVPANLRKKTYSAASGYVYQYSYRGYKDLPPNTPGRLYVFSTTRNRSLNFDIQVELLDSEVRMAANWSLTNAERYAVAKMTLFQAFDESSPDALFATPLRPAMLAIQEHLTSLGRFEPPADS